MTTNSNEPLAGGRSLPPLLFVTHAAALVGNVGQAAADEALDLVRTAGHELLDVAPPDAVKAIRRESAGKVGVVLLGGYDVLPAHRLDPVPKEVRVKLGSLPQQVEGLITWSDRDYGKTATRRTLPVSRIPDAHSARTLLGAMRASRSRLANRRFGLRNVKRTYPDVVFSQIDGQERMLVSEPTRAADVNPAALAADYVYLLLHGDKIDHSFLCGETAAGSDLRALDVANLPTAMSGIVLSGACFSALTVSETAGAHAAGPAFTTVATGASVALTALERGALAFVGPVCAHVSLYGNTAGGGIVHQLFWGRIKLGDPPAPALHRARMRRLRGLSKNPSSDPVTQALNFWACEQFTCLGLGW